MKKAISFILLATVVTTLNGQDMYTQTIRGAVVDAVTGHALIGANVILMNSEPTVGTSTDLHGNFKLEDV
ncbi:MAG: carboxypeptidase-like regulatory domain-containing protein, partial [Bacteroidales bacterium]|nr:carboxypeptidase-like regulatory domain-containing protein [Bacteroidales bacterium]